MPFVTWSSELDIGVDAMNSEHKQLLSLMDALYTAVEQKKPKTDQARILASLEMMTRRHFANEEVFMETIGCDGAAAHKEIHEGLLRKLLEHRSNFERASILELPDEFFMFLKVWLSAHIKGLHKKYGKLAQSKGKGAA